MYSNSQPRAYRWARAPDVLGSILPVGMPNFWAEQLRLGKMGLEPLRAIGLLSEPGPGFTATAHSRARQLRVRVELSTAPPSKRIEARAKAKEATGTPGGAAQDALR